MTVHLRIAIVCFLFVPSSIFGNLSDFFGPDSRTRPYRFVEEFYGLHATSHDYGKDAIVQQLRFLHLALRAPFDHPQRALAPCNSEIEYNVYQYLMYFHISFLLVKGYVAMASSYDKDVVSWMDIRYADTLLRGFQVAYEIYELASAYWYHTKRYAHMSWNWRTIRLEGPVMLSVQEVLRKVIVAEGFSKDGRVPLASSPQYQDYLNRDHYLDYDFGFTLSTRIQALKDKVKEVCTHPLVGSLPQALGLCKELDNAFKRVGG